MKYMQYFGILLNVTFTCAAFAGNGTIYKKAHPIKSQYIVVLESGTAGKSNELASSFARLHGGTPIAAWDDVIRGFAIANIPDAAAEAIAHDPRVAYVEEDELARLPYCPDSRSRCADGVLPWQLDRIDQWKLPLNGKYGRPMAGNEGFGTTIFVVDSGIRRTHTDFNSPDGTYNRVGDGVSYVNDGRGTDDCYNHGTTVSSAAAGRYSSAGKEATIVPVRVFDCSGGGSLSRILSALDWISTHHTRRSIVNLSIETDRSVAFNSAVTNLFNSGLVMVAAAGNDSGDGCFYSPCSATSVICVGASTRNDSIASYSNRGHCITMFAPGDRIGVGYFQDDNAFDCNPGFSGTSMAAPVVAGIAAQYWSIETLATNTDVRRALIDNTIKDVLSVDTTSPNRLAGSFSDGSSCDVYQPPTQ